MDVARRAVPTSANGEDRGKGPSADLGAIAERAGKVFVPVLPLFEARANASRPAAPVPAPAADGGAVSVGAAVCSAPPLLRLGDVQRLLEEQRRSLAAEAAALAAAFPAAAAAPPPLLSAAEAALCLGLRHLRDVLAQFADGLDYVEAMLSQQLRAAVGRELTPHDFAAYTTAHEARLYAPRYAPAPFSHAVRRPEHSPEGSVAIEGAVAADGDLPWEPVRTLSRLLESDADRAPLTFALNAATRVSFGGERRLHALLVHEFADSPPPRLQLAARARQFSAFILVVGRMGPARTFEPKHALIVQNKDEVTLPLELEQLPTPKAFRDAIASLSPEQQRFARAYRAMQLEGSVFGVLVLQLKPSLGWLNYHAACAVGRHPSARLQAS